jgi:hypothetical protein
MRVQTAVKRRKLICEEDQYQAQSSAAVPCQKMSIFDGEGLGIPYARTPSTMRASTAWKTRIGKTKAVLNAIVAILILRCVDDQVV